MSNAEPVLQSAKPTPRWPLPIQPQSYPDRCPTLNAEEQTLLEQYATAPAGFMTAGRARNILHRLERFEAPFLATVALTPHMDSTRAAARRHLYSFMARTKLAFWAWSEEIWAEVISTAAGQSNTSGTRFWMLLLAYIFADSLYIGQRTVYSALAAVLFGPAVVEEEVDKVRQPLVTAGYTADQQEGSRLRWITALCMLINRHPRIETFSAELLLRVYALLAEIPGVGQLSGRWALLRLQTSLCQLGILDEPVILEAKVDKADSLAALWQDDGSVDPLWCAWVRAFYEQTPSANETSRRQKAHFLLMAGRWLKQYHPQVCAPGQ